jgi:putative tryptophan/tyrosine transport system substrate-binding protein
VATRGARAAAGKLLQIGTASSYDLSGFRQGLRDKGFIENQNLEIEYRFAEDNVASLPGLVSELVRHRVRVIATVGNSLPARAAKGATSTIPIVFGFGADPVRLGLVASLNRPGENVTGVVSRSNELWGKQIGILHELMPQTVRFGVLTNPRNVDQESIIKDSQAAASRLGLTVEILNVNDSAEIDAAFVRLHDENRLQGLLVTNDPFFIAQRVQVVILAARYAVPAIYPFREQTEAGGLLSYGPNLADRDRQVGVYVGRILDGENPGDLLVQQVSKFEFIINLKTAKALGLAIPPGLFSIADEVIE